LIAQAALVLGALAVGHTTIRGAAAEDALDRTAAALAALGARLEHHPDGLWTIDGVGIGGLAEPDQALDLGPTSAGLHLLVGLAATHPITIFFTGAPALPLAPLIAPLALLGAEITARPGGFLPLAVTGAAFPVPFEHALALPSAEIAGALLFAALNIPGRSSISSPQPIVGRLALLFERFGASVTIEPDAAGGERVALEGQPELVPAHFDLKDLLA